MAFRRERQILAWAMVVLLFLATSLPALASDIALTQTSARLLSGSALITDVKIVRVSGILQIHIIADRPLRPRCRRLHDPERFVVDLQDAVFAGDNRSIDVDSSDIQSVRIAPLYQQEGRVARLVVDLAGPRQFVLTPAGDTLILSLAAAENAAARPTAAISSGLSSFLHQEAPATPSSQLDREHPAFAEVASRTAASAPQGVTLIAQNQALSGDLNPGNEPVLTVQLPKEERQPQTTANAIAARLDDNSPPAAMAAVAVETFPSEPTAPAAETSSSDAIIYGTGVTGSAQDPTLGVDIEHILGPGKKDKKKAAEAGGAGEGSFPHAFHLSGQAIGGYYRANGESGYIFHDASPVASLHLDASGYLYHPGFLTFTVKPQGSLGRQSSEAMFPDGRGVAASSTFLGGGATPLTISYSRLTRQLMTFGPIENLAGLQADTSQESLSANWTLRLQRLPEIVLEIAKYSDNYQPLAALASRTSNAGRLGSVGMRERVMGWNLQSNYKLERSSQDLLDVFDPAQTYRYQHKDQEARASADRDFGRWLTVNFLAGATRSRYLLQDRPFDQSYRFVTGNFLSHPTKKLTLTFHGGLTNNVLGATVERSAGNTSTPQQPFLLVPSTARLQLANYSVSAEYALTKELHLQADGLRETTTPQQTVAGAAPESSLSSAQAGISWSRRIRFLQFQSHYAANIGNFVYGPTGSSRSSGQRAELGATAGSPHTLELTAGLRGSMQDVTGSTYMRDRSWGANLILSHTFHRQWKLQAGYNRDRDHYDFLNQALSSASNGFSLMLYQPRLDFSVSHNIRDGLTFQADPRLQYVSSSQAGMLLGAFPGTLMVPASADWSSAAATVRPFGKFRARGLWMRSRQQLQDASNNRYTEWEASAGYQFRFLNFDAGYIFHDQTFGLNILQRDRFFVRVVRDFTIF